MKAPAHDESVRLQIPVHSKVLEELKDLAGRFDRPVTWVSRMLVEDGVENQESFMKWFCFRVLGNALGNPREKYQIKNLPLGLDGEIVRIQVPISEVLNARLERLAEKHRRNACDLASMLLVRTLDEEAWIARIVSGWVGQVIKKAARPRSSRERHSVRVAKK